jgi:hypothetical protein
MYDLVDECDPEKWISGLEIHSGLSRDMIIGITEYWNTQKDLYIEESDTKKQKKAFADLITL